MMRLRVGRILPSREENTQQEEILRKQKAFGKQRNFDLLNRKTQHATQDYCHSIRHPLKTGIISDHAQIKVQF